MAARDSERKTSYPSVDELKRSDLTGLTDDFILRLLNPKGGERLLSVGDGSGRYLWSLKNRGCHITGVVSSASLLEEVRDKVGQNFKFYLAGTEDLPFSDNEFDIVLLIRSLEFAIHPEQLISEAIRVSSGRVLIGVPNKYSLSALQYRTKTCFFAHLEKTSVRFFHASELKAMVRRLLPGVNIQWGSVLFFPPGWQDVTARFERYVPTVKNPLGSFLCLSFPVIGNIRTVQDVIQDSFKLPAEKGEPIQGVVRGVRIVKEAILYKSMKACDVPCLLVPSSVLRKKMR